MSLMASRGQIAHIVGLAAQDKNLTYSKKCVIIYIERKKNKLKIILIKENENNLLTFIKKYVIIIIERKIILKKLFPLYE